MKPSKSPTFKKSEPLGHICFFEALWVRCDSLYFSFRDVIRAAIDEVNSENSECGEVRIDFFRYSA